MRKGSADALTRSPDDVPAILLGTDLAETLEVHVGDRVQLISPNGTMTPLGMFARPRTLEVFGIFSLGLFQFDLVAALTGSQFGEVNPISAVIYALVGLSAIVLIPVLVRWVTTQEELVHA